MKIHQSIAGRRMLCLTMSILIVAVFRLTFVFQKENSFCLVKDFHEVILDLRNHSSFVYLNKAVLTEQYFLDAADSLDDEYVYLILSNTRTASSRIISLFTDKEFNHVSLSFDYDLKTAVSYNGGNNNYSPGLNPELIEDLVKAKEASAFVYSLKVTKEQKTVILSRVRNINDEGSSYNILGLIFNRSFKPNIMYCSQFVYSMLNEAGVQYFTVKKNILKPSDFIELDYHRNLKFCYEM